MTPSSCGHSACKPIKTSGTNVANPSGGKAKQTGFSVTKWKEDVKVWIKYLLSDVWFAYVLFPFVFPGGGGGSENVIMSGCTVFNGSDQEGACYVCVTTNSRSRWSWSSGGINETSNTALQRLNLGEEPQPLECKLSEVVFFLCHIL